MTEPKAAAGPVAAATPARASALPWKLGNTMPPWVGPPLARGVMTTARQIRWWGVPRPANREVPRD
jgi:hypothetical protein